MSSLATRTRGSEVGERRGAKDQRVERSLPPWQAWRTRSRAARAIRFIETYCRIPSGVGAGELIRLHRFQKESLEALLADGVRTGGEQIPRGNAKSTLWAAVGLWAVCDHADSPQVPLVAFNRLQAQRTLLRPVLSMVHGHPELEDRVVTYRASGDQRVWSAWNDGELIPLPADPERLQGLNPTVALVDEAQTLPPAVLSAILQGAGKRAESLVLAIGTPSPGGQDSALHMLRERARAGAPVAWVEYAAPAGCALDDRAAWAAANPALAVGLLHADVLESELSLVPEADFRCYRLGQWVDAIVSDWLPSGAWEACPRVGMPPDGAEVVLSLAATWNSSAAIVGATLDGGLFMFAAGESPEDDVLERAFAEAAARWSIAEVVVAPRCRPELVHRLGDREGDRPALDVTVWPNKPDLEVMSATEWRRAIVEGKVAHDHSPLLGQHVSATVARSTPDGSMKLVGPDDGRPVDAARAARMAWWIVRDVGSRWEAPAVF